MGMRAMRIAALLCALGAPAGADSTTAPPGATSAGPQAVPPVGTSEPSLAQQADGRRAVRGCAVGEPCARASEVLREFELETLPPPGNNPWVASERTPARSRVEGAGARVVSRPSQLRPDAPWLDKLELPDLPVRWTQRLADYLVFYRDDPRGRSIMQAWLVAQGRYREMITAALRKARLPEDLLYVAMIESSYNPSTLSRAGALGLWQFMPEAAKIYGLRRDRWVDERKDPYRATMAQLDYFADLYQRFGDWHLALASFNVGYGAMLRSIARYNTNDYYQLCEYENAVPWETCWYTPKVLATAIVGRNRAAFGFDKLTVSAPEQWDEIAAPASIPLGVIAKAAGVPVEEVARLNPHLKHDRTPPGEPGYVVRVPFGKKADAQRRIAELQSDWDGYDAYVVAHGERFEDVATTYGLTTSALRRLNDVTSEAEIEGGTVLVVPRISSEQREKNRAKARGKLHTSGVDQKEGELLVVPVLDKDAVIAGKQRVFYRVVAGDSVRSVARAFGVARDDLVAWNGLDRDAKLHPRMVVVAWVADGFDARGRGISLLDADQLVIVTRGSPEHMDIAEQRVGRVRMTYTASKAEKLGEIAKKFGMGSHDLARINRCSYDRVLAKGESVIVYQVADPSRSERAEEQWKKTPRARRGKLGGAPRATTSASASRKPDAGDGEEVVEDDEAVVEDDEDAAPVKATSKAPSKSEKSDKPEKSSKAEKPDKAEKADKAEKSSKAPDVRGEKSGKSAPSEKKSAPSAAKSDTSDAGGPVTRPTDAR